MDKKTIVTIVATTYFPYGVAGIERRNNFIEVSESWRTNFELEDYYSLYLHVADDGSDDIEKFVNEQIAPKWDGRVSLSVQRRHGVGASLNAGFRKAFERSPYVLFAVDDWELFNPFDPNPWLLLLEECSDVGMVRLGPPHPNISGRVEVFTEDWQGWGLRLDRKGYAFAHRPALYHKRMIDAYGWFEEDCTALECEANYNTRFALHKGPDIVLALPHLWQHRESVELAYLDPKREHK